tara:strand:- start:529 stop:1371 length:843 start_codon:yes stop_codon:yes gene_type:complete
MAVKPITNPFPMPIERVNRAQQVSTRSTTSSSSNREQTVIPGSNYSDNYEMALMDLDKSLLSHVNKVMNIQISEAGELRDVPVMYGNEERWANFRRRGVIRDRNGSLVLPLIMLRRNLVNFNDNLPMWQHDLLGKSIEIVRSSKYSSKNQYSRFALQQGIKPVEERIITGAPQYVNLTYSFVVWTQYVQQMNSVVEQFLNQHNRYWGDNTSYRFLCKVEGGINDATQLEVNQERIIRSTFDIILQGYLLHESTSNIVNKKQMNFKKSLTRGRVTFSENIE